MKLDFANAVQVRKCLINHLNHYVGYFFGAPFRHASKNSCWTDLRLSVVNAINVNLVEWQPIITCNQSH